MGFVNGLPQRGRRPPSKWEAPSSSPETSREVDGEPGNPTIGGVAGLTRERGSQKEGLDLMNRRLYLLLLLTGLVLLTRQPVPAAETPLRVACLGDSLTAGDGDDEGGGGYPRRLQACLQQTRRGSQVKSYGVSGQTAQMVLEGYEQHPSQVKEAMGFKPDVVCLWVGSNDLWYLYEYGKPDTAAEAADAQRFRRNVRAIIDAFHKRGAHVIVALLDDQSKRPVAVEGKAFMGISKAELARMSKQVKVYNAILREEAKRAGAGMADFSTTTIFTDRATIVDDGNHPNAKGYDRIAEIWWAAFPKK